MATFKSGDHQGTERFLILSGDLGTACVAASITKSVNDWVYCSVDF